MIIGAMNHPARDVAREIAVFAELGLEFIDLTLEPPAAFPDRLDAAEIQRALSDHGLKVVGHTPYYLPLASPFETLRAAAVEEMRRCVDFFAQLGARWVNVHPDGHTPFQEPRFAVERNLASLGDLLPAARAGGIGLMIENLPGRFNTADQLAELLDPLPEIGLHLDIGHCNLQTERNTCFELLRRYGGRLRHVHLHDNKGGYADLHLPLGCGTLDTRGCLRALKASGYDGTLTLEVFSADSHYLAYSRDQVRRWWEEA